MFRRSPGQRMTTPATVKDSIMRNPEEVTILITGATDGLGQRVATDLAEKGVTLLLHGRDPDKGERVRAKIREATGNDRLHYFNADLASLAEVERMAAAVASTSQ